MRSCWNWQIMAGHALEIKLGIQNGTSPLQLCESTITNLWKFLLYGQSFVKEGKTYILATARDCEIGL